MNSDRGHDAELSQQLLEWAYGLLDEAESAKLRERIDREPTVARLYEEVLRNKEILGSAVRSPGKPMSFRGIRPAEVNSRRRRQLQVANILMALSASVLLVAGLTGYQFVQIHRKSLEENSIVVDVAGPAKLAEGFENQFELVTRNLKREPIATEVNVQFISAKGIDLFSKTIQSGADGRALVSAPRSLRSSEVTQLAIKAQSPRNQSTLVQPVTAEPPSRSAYLAMDRLSYRPGDSLFFRAVLLESLGLEPVNQVPVQFELSNARGESVSDPQTSPTERGVAAGSIPLPASLPRGEYQLSARTAASSAERFSRSLFIRGSEPVRFKKGIEFDRASYAPGDKVSARFRAERIEGPPAVEAPARVEVIVGGREVLRRETKTDQNGEFSLMFSVPAGNAIGPSFVGVQLGDDKAIESYRRDLPLAQDGVDLRFFPEGGALVANLPNRVYFQAVGPREEPVHVAGQIRAAGKIVTKFESSKDGMGSVAITPTSPGETFEVELSTPPLPGAAPTFPRVSDKTIVLQAKEAVVGGGEPIELVVRSTQPGASLVISAHCRGVPVAHRLIETSNESRVSMSVPDEASGVIRVTAFEAQEPQRLVPVAERLLYREPIRKLALSLVTDAPQYKPGGKVELIATITDEQGRPVPEAVLGVAVVDRASLIADEDRKRTSLATHFLLWSRIDHPSDLENADLLLSNTPEARASLDLVLGTHGWRTFRPPVASNVAVLEDSERLDMPAYASNDAVVRSVANDYEAATGSILFFAGGAFSLVFGGVFLYWFVVLIVAQTPLMRAVTVAITLSAAGVAAATLFSLREQEASPTEPSAQREESAPVAEWAFKDEVTRDKKVSAQQRGRSGEESWFDAPPPEPTANESLDEKPSLKSASKIQSDQGLGEGKKEVQPEAAAEKKMAKDSLRRVPADGAPDSVNPPAPLPAVSEAPLAEGAQVDASTEQRPNAPASPDRPIPASQQRASGGGSSQTALGREHVRSFAHTRGLRELPYAPSPQTLYWNPMLVCDERGQARIEFDLTDAPSVFDVIVEAHAPGGRLGTGKMAIRTTE